MSDDAYRFLETGLFAAPFAEDQRAILVGFPGDPGDRAKASWRPHPWRPGREIPFEERDNAYVCVSTVRRRADGGFRRRKEDFDAAHAVMVDDVVQKIPRAVVERLAPSAIIETSPGSEQWWYFFVEPLLERARFEHLVQGFIDKNLMGADPGMSGSMRVARLPGFTNGKPQHNGFRTRLVMLDGARRYAPEEVARAFGVTEKRARPAAALELELRRLAGAEMGVPQATRLERVQAFATYLRCLRQAGMVQGEPDMGGWLSIECPFRDQHTGAANNGAAIRVPAEENGWNGAFRCMHGHCSSKRWRDLTDWIADEAVRAMDEAAQAEADRTNGKGGAT